MVLRCADVPAGQMRGNPINLPTRHVTFIKHAGSFLERILESLVEGMLFACSEDVAQEAPETLVTGGFAYDRGADAGYLRYVCADCEIGKGEGTEGRHGWDGVFGGIVGGVRWSRRQGR